MKDKDNILNFPPRSEGNEIAPWITSFADWKNNLHFSECQRIANHLFDMEDEIEITLFLFIYSCWHETHSGTTEDFWNDEDVAYALETLTEQMRSL